jgi:hypothetical protein
VYAKKNRGKTEKLWKIIYQPTRTIINIGMAWHGSNLGHKIQLVYLLDTLYGPQSSGCDDDVALS